MLDLFFKSTIRPAFMPLYAVKQYFGRNQCLTYNIIIKPSVMEFEIVLTLCIK